ncbi:translation initiation factor IF-2 [Desulfonema ishimotonii]|uniref:Translation initiation factor IF-2 n=1 Tax=Desulfonema ishimotonii TaxID=45657 RepID=A0A401G475_9BACT|nr:translation initiation factor IF-2 [Desulfonema ishimotonii]GBC63925.1 translation initiation factor IF-2 [Desulfonema ishimotonii]
MAKIRVYELARVLNMKNKALLDKMSDMNIAVSSHMSSLDDETVANIKANILGKKKGAAEVTRVKPTVIRKRKKRTSAETEDTAPEEMTADTDAAPETEDRSDTTEIEQDAPPEPEKESADAGTPEPDNDQAVIPSSDEKPGTGKKKAKKAKKAKDAPAKIIQTPSDTPPKAESDPIEAPAVSAVEQEPAGPAEVGEKPMNSEKTTTRRQRDADASTAEPSGAAETSTDQPETPEKADKKPEKRKKKKRANKKDTPARIIKLPPKVAAPPSEKSSPAKSKPARSTEQAAGGNEKTTAGELPVRDRKKKFHKKKGEVTPSAGEETRRGKKKTPFRRKEVVEGAALYGKGKRGKRGKARAVKAQKTQITTPKAIKRRVKIDDTIVLADLAKRMGIKASEMIKKLMMLGVMVTVNQTIDFDTAVLVASEFGYEVEKAAFEEDTFLHIEEESTPGAMVGRSPVVTIMGHVDHGKTSLLDVIRKTRITEIEAGGITQHIGAYSVKTSGGQVTFLDTPGHEAFTAMRARGAIVTDIVVLVVAADDGVMPQTIEAINHSKAANVPIIVAINKMDKDGADPDRVTRELSEHNLMPEDWGGDTIFVKVSAKQNQGIDALLEMILLQAEVLELKANPDKHAKGYVVESKLDAGRGPVATILVQEGTLRAGDPVVCGVHHGKIRAMLNDRGQQVESAGPSEPVEVLGLSGVPNAGDEMIVLDDDKSAKQVSEHRLQKQRSIGLAKTSRISLEKLFERMQEGEVKDLNVILKADVHGSLEAMSESLVKLSNDEVSINIIHAATGTVSESDISLAAVSNAIIIGFNVRPTPKVQTFANEEHVDMRFYNVIYNVIKDVKDAILGMMESTFEERVLGRAETREVFHVPKVGTIAGCYVTDGNIQRGKRIRLVRDGVVIHEGNIASLRRFKDDVKEVQSGYECGIGIERYNDIKVGDIIECYYLEEIKPELA